MKSAIQNSESEHLVTPTPPMPGKGYAATVTPILTKTLLSKPPNLRRKHSRCCLETVTQYHTLKTLHEDSLE